MTLSFPLDLRFTVNRKLFNANLRLTESFDTMLDLSPVFNCKIQTNKQKQKTKHVIIPLLFVHVI